MYSSSQPPNRVHSRTHHYVQRVQDSLTSQLGKFICSIFLSLLLVAAVIIFVLLLSLRPHRPRFYLNSFTMNQLGSPISVNLTDRNPNNNIGIYYGDMNGSVYYFDKVIASGPVMSAFYQETKSTTLVQAQLGADASQSVLSQIVGNESNGLEGLRLVLESIIRFKVSTWDTHHHRMHVSCELAVGADGNLLAQYVNERCPIYF